MEIYIVKQGSIFLEKLFKKYLGLVLFLNCLKYKGEKCLGHHNEKKRCRAKTIHYSISKMVIESKAGC